MKYQETMWAEMKPYVYGGKSCEEHDPNWYTFAAGDMQGGDDGNEISFSAHIFPPGTKVVVSEPVCPQCDEIPYRSSDPVKFIGEDGDVFYNFKWICQEDCDFDWRGWANGEYS